VLWGKTQSHAHEPPRHPNPNPNPTPDTRSLLKLSGMFSCEEWGRAVGIMPAAAGLLMGGSTAAIGMPCGDVTLPSFCMTLSS
jgi:hypothetical protein